MKQTVLITAASSGIGKACARLFAERGWQVVAAMRAPYLEKELATLESVLVVRLDIEERKSIDEAIHAGIGRFGKIDLLINSPEGALIGLFESISRARIEEQFDVSVFGAMDVARAILPHFRKNRGGLIINISGDTGVFTLPLMSIHCASRFAIEGFSEALAYELASQNIGVKLVIPHDHVCDASFEQRTSKERAIAASLSTYNDFVDHARRVLAQVAVEPIPNCDDVARVVHDAATDGSGRLRYFAGDDSRGFIRARQEMADQDYIAFMRSHFLTPSEVEH